MVNYSYSIYYNAISLLIKESLYLPLFAKYAPALGTRKAPLEGAFLVPYSAACRGLGTLHVTPSLNPSPRGRDSAAEAAVRLRAQSLRSESASIQDQYNTKWALTPTPQRHHSLRYSSPCHLLFFKALFLRGLQNE